MFNTESIGRRARHGIAAATLMAVMTAGSAQAAIIEVLISGDTDEADGDIAYTPGGQFSARALFDGDFADTNPDANVGSFFDFGTGGSALISLEVSTEFGTVLFTPGNIVNALLPVNVAQINSPTTQTVGISSSPVPDGTGFEGTIGALDPDVIGLFFAASGPNDYFFTDPNVLFSGIGNHSTDALILGGFITLSDFSTGDETNLPFTATEFEIRYFEDDTGSDPSTVPAPGGLLLIATGFFGLLWSRRDGSLV